MTAVDTASGVASADTLADLIVFGLPFALSAGLSNDGGTEIKDPRDLVRADLGYVLAFGFAVAVAAGIIAGVVAQDASGVVERVETGVLKGTGFALLAGSTFGLLRAAAGMRYLMFLLCVRVGPRALPWRLGRFLHWATGAGLMRTSGIAYQFRHRELQDWLARNPTPRP
ncbi:hypothetical protein [Embleya sp. NPDC020630]|uniref:hypothetical protein n=1 Tax=Embleya sp. NPDC020630 TaxID=3363979 RepID=UPI0037AFF86D